MINCFYRRELLPVLLKDLQVSILIKII